MKVQFEFPNMTEGIRISVIGAPSDDAAKQALTVIVLYCRELDPVKMMNAIARPDGKGNLIMEPE